MLRKSGSKSVSFCHIVRIFPAFSLQVLKKDLKALNSSVVVEKEEYDEVVAIKPMFLVMDYK